MSRTITTTPPAFPVHRFTVDQYRKMIENGILDENDNVELLEGYIVPKMAHGDDHDNAIDFLNRLLFGLVPASCTHRCQSVLVLPNGMPEPDFVICTPAQARHGKHPTPADTFVVMEVSDTTLFGDRNQKQRMYARVGIPIYWIINLEDRQIEVYTDPVTPSNADPHYQTRTDYLPGQDVPLVIAGTQFGVIPVDAILP